MSFLLLHWTQAQVFYKNKTNTMMVILLTTKIEIIITAVILN